MSNETAVGAAEAGTRGGRRRGRQREENIQRYADVTVTDELLPSQYASLTGDWVLDLSRSQRLSDHLRVLGVPEVEILAQAVVEQMKQSRVAIALDEYTLTIHKNTAENNTTETFNLGEEGAMHLKSGAIKRYTASLLRKGQLTGYVVGVKVLTPDGRDLSQLDVRQLVNDGHVHVQELTVKNNATGAQCTTTRTWVRVRRTK